jgi:spore maturation protein CgeB
MIRALAARGHRITFVEPDAYERQQHRDIEDPPWAEVVIYEPNESAALKAVSRARGFDIIVKASGVGIFDALLEQAVLNVKNSANLIAFWDVDAPATLDRVNQNPHDPFTA